MPSFEFLTHTYTRIHTHALTHTRIHTHVHTPTLTHTRTYSLTHTGSFRLAPQETSGERHVAAVAVVVAAPGVGDWSLSM